MKVAILISDKLKKFESVAGNYACIYEPVFSGSNVSLPTMWGLGRSLLSSVCTKWTGF